MAKVNILKWDATNLVPQLLGGGDTAMINAIDVTGSAGGLSIGGSDADAVYLGASDAPVYSSGAFDALASFTASADAQFNAAVTASQGMDVDGVIDVPGGTSFSIDGSALPSQFTGPNVTTLLNGSVADSLHSHDSSATSLTGSLLVDVDIVHRYTNEVPISGTEIVYLEAGNNRVALADRDAVGTSRIIGLASGSTTVIYESGSQVPCFTIYGDRFGGFTGLTPAAIYYLDSTPGAMTTTPGLPANGNMIVQVGVATSDTEMLFQPDIRVRGLA